MIPRCDKTVPADLFENPDYDRAFIVASLWDTRFDSAEADAVRLAGKINNR